MKLSFEDRIEWDEAKGATIPQLTDAEIDEVLREYRPTAENRCCECGGTRVCPACLLTQVIDQLRKPHGVLSDEDIASCFREVCGGGIDRTGVASDINQFVIPTVRRLLAQGAQP